MNSKIYIFFCIALSFSNLFAAEYLMSFTQSSGGLTGQKIMYTTDGTIWESNCPVYNNSNYYYMQSLFDGIHANGAWQNGWLADGVGIPKDHYLTITFPDTRYVTRINTFPIMYPGYWSDAHLYVSSNGTDFNHVGDIICGTHQNDPAYWNYYVGLQVNQHVKEIKYVFFNEQYGSGNDPVIIELEIFGDNAITTSVPEPSTSILGIITIALLLRFSGKLKITG